MAERLCVAHSYLKRGTCYLVNRRDCDVCKQQRRIRRGATTQRRDGA